MGEDRFMTEPPIPRSQCVRCGKYILWSSDEYATWEQVEEGEVCEPCLTGGESAEIVDDFMDGLDG